VHESGHGIVVHRTITTSPEISNKLLRGKKQALAGNMVVEDWQLAGCRKDVDEVTANLPC